MDNRAYYDAFSAQYDKHRGDNEPGGYHELVDELESELVRLHGTAKDVLEVGCGTGLILARIAQFAKRAEGVDLSEGMLAHAQRRGLNVRQGSATELPFAANSFDVVCSFKVLAHVAEIENALREMARVVRPGGVILAEFYNPHSLRGIVKRWGPKGRVAEGTTESDVFTRYDSPSEAIRYIPDGCRLTGSRGIRMTIPAARAMRVPILGRLLGAAERQLCDTWFSRFAGFWIAVISKQA